MNRICSLSIPRVWNEFSLKYNALIKNASRINEKKNPHPDKLKLLLVLLRIFQQIASIES